MIDSFIWACKKIINYKNRKFFCWLMGWLISLYALGFVPSLFMDAQVQATADEWAIS